MTNLLQKAVAKVETLPYEVQDAIAARIIADFEDELAWQESFATTTDEQWDKLADMVRQDIASCDTVLYEDMEEILQRKTQGKIELFSHEEVWGE